MKLRKYLLKDWVEKIVPVDTNTVEIHFKEGDKIVVPKKDISKYTSYKFYISQKENSKEV